MKKIVSILLIILICVSLFACGKSDAAKAFEEMVNGIGTVSLDSEEAITIAENAYQALTDKDRSAVKNSNTTLKEIRAEYQTLREEAEQKTRFDELTGLIDAVGTVSLDSQEAIIAAEEAYSKFSETDKKAYGDNINALFDKRSEFDALAEADLDKRLNEAVTLIKAIGTVSIDSGSGIEAAEAAVNALSEDEQGMISDDISALANARKQYDSIVEEKAAEERAAHAAEVDESIQAIGTVTVNSKDSIDAARTLYDALAPEEISLVENYSILVEAEKDYKQAVIDAYSKKYEKETDAVEGITWYLHNNMPDYIDSRCYVIPYIGVKGNNKWICVRYNYTADNWIFWKKLTIVVDGEKTTKSVGYYDVTRDNSGGNIWEYYDDALNINLPMDSKELTLLRAIADSNETIIRFEGDNYYDDLYVRDSDKQMIRDALALYEAMLG